MSFSEETRDLKCHRRHQFLSIGSTVDLNHLLDNYSEPTSLGDNSRCH